MKRFSSYNGDLLEMMTPNVEQQHKQEIGHLQRRELYEAFQSFGASNSAIFDRFSSRELNELLHQFKTAVESQTAPAKTTNRSRDYDALPKLSAIDKKILKALVSSAGGISSLALSRDLDIPLSTVQRRRKRLEGHYLESSYSLKIDRFGWRAATLFVSTHNGRTNTIGKELLAWPSVLYIVRTIGENAADLKADVIFRNNSELLDLIEKVKTIEGIKNVCWTESIQVIGKNNDRYNLVIDSQ